MDVPINEADAAWLSQFVPEGGIITGFIVFMSYLDADGEERMKAHNTFDDAVVSMGALMWTLMEVYTEYRLHQATGEEEDDG